VDQGGLHRVSAVGSLYVITFQGSVDDVGRPDPEIRPMELPLDRYHWTLLSDNH